jgi:hypothetical protein
MKPLRRARLALRLLVGSGVLIAQQPALFAQQPVLAPGPPAAEAQEEAQGQIAGTVVSAKTGELLRSVSLTVRGVRRRGQATGRPVMREAVSGMDGRFLVTGLPAGDYDVVAIKPGYGSAYAFRPQARLRLGANESRDDVVIRLQPSAVVTGRVFDAYGEPLPEARVHAVTRRYFPGRQPRWTTTQQARTNDLGEYRLHSLEPGKYVLVAQAPRASSPRGVGYAEFAPSYYLNAPSLEQAAQLRLAYGAEQNGVDFRLEPSPETLVRGIIIDRVSGEPCGNCPVQVSDENAMLGFDFSAGPTQEGIFALHGLRPAPHALIIHMPGDGPSGMHVEHIDVPESGELEVRVVVGGVQTVSGEFVFEDPPEPPQQAPAAQQPGAQVQAPAPRPQPAMLVLESLGPFPFQGGRETVPPEGGGFELTEVQPGQYKIRLYGPDGYLRAITLDGRDLGGPEVTVPSDGPLSGLKLHIAFDGATVSGIVRPATNEKTSDLGREQVVTAVPEGDSNPYANQGLTRAEPDGSFTLRGLAPGTYTLYAVPTPTVNIEDPDLRQALKPYGKQISLTKNEQARVDLTAVPDTIELW